MNVTIKKFFKSFWIAIKIALNECNLENELFHKLGEQLEILETILTAMDRQSDKMLVQMNKTTKKFLFKEVITIRELRKGIIRSFLWHMYVYIGN